MNFLGLYIGFSEEKLLSDQNIKFCRAIRGISPLAEEGAENRKLSIALAADSELNAPPDSYTLEQQREYWLRKLEKYSFSKDNTPMYYVNDKSKFITKKLDQIWKIQIKTAK